MTDDTANSLIIAYKCSSYKRTCFDHDRYEGSSPTSQFKFLVPIQVSCTMYQSKIPTEIELNRNEKKQIQQKLSKLKHRVANDE